MKFLGTGFPEVGIVAPEPGSYSNQAAAGGRAFAIGAS
jgi:hypothetical protein